MRIVIEEPGSSDNPTDIDFRMPKYFKNDLIYCQMSLRHYLRVHQLWTLHLEQNPSDTVAKAYLQGLEEDIKDLGIEQNDLVKKLRRYIENFCNKFINVSIKSCMLRETIDTAVNKSLYAKFNDLSNPTSSKSCDKIIPVKVKCRQTSNELLKLFELKIKRSKDGDGKKFVPKLESKSASVSSKSSTQSLDALVPVIACKKQESLLKPKEERLGTVLKKFDKSKGLTVPTEFVEEEKVIPVVTPAICNSRMNLLNALSKARSLRFVEETKKIKSEPTTAIVTTRSSSKSVSPTLQSIDEPSPSTSPSLIQESAAPSPIAVSDSSCENDLPQFSPDPPCTELYEAEVNQECFLKLFNLCTHEKRVEMSTRRRVRRRRNVQSTEKYDFHYGRFDIYDASFRQSVLKRKKPVLYSPPATRNFKKRCTNEDIIAAAAITNITSNNSSGINTVGKVNKIETVTNGSDYGGRDRSCTSCRNLFVKNGEKSVRCDSCQKNSHLMKSHQNAISSQQNLRSRETISPPSYRNQQKVQNILSSQPRGQDKFTKLHKKHVQLKFRHDELVQNTKLLSRKISTQQNLKENLTNNEIFLRNRIKKIRHFLTKFGHSSKSSSSTVKKDSHADE